VYFINKPKLAFSTILLLTALSGCSENKTTTEYISEAKVAFSNGQNSLAIINLKNVLKTEKNNLEARFLLGSVYAKQGLWVNAEKELRIASNAGFTDGNIDILLTKIHYRLEDTDYLISVKNLQNEYSDLAKIYLAIIALKQGDVAEGRVIFDEITLGGSDQDLSNLAMAWDSFLNADFVGSLKHLDTLALASVIKEDVIELRVAILVAQKNHEAAAEQLEMFLSIHPQSHVHRLQLAEQYVKYRNYPDAEKNADLLLSLFENNIILNRIKAEIKFNAKDYSSAKEFAEKALRNSEDTLSKVIAGMSAYQLGQYESSYNYLNAVSTHFAEAHPVNQIIISLSNQLSFSTGTSSELLSDTVLSLINSGDYKRTKNVLIKASESSRLNDGVIDFQLGLLKIIEGDSTFTEDFERAISNGFNDIEPKVLLAELYLREKEYIKVLEIADSLSSSNKVIANLLKGSVYLEKEEYDNAILAYEGILSSETEHMGAMFKLSETHFKNGNTAKSIELLKNIYKISASNVYAVRSLFKFSLEPANKKMFEQFFISQAKVDKKNINRQIVLTEFYLLHNEVEQALSIASRYLLKNPEQLEMTLLKTRALLSLNRINDVKDILVTLNNIAPTHPAVIKNKAYILNLDGNKTEAIKVIEDFRANNNGILNDDLLLLSSIIYVENINILKAEKSLNKVKNKQHPRYSRIAGKMALIKGNSPLAVELLSKAYKSSPSQLVALELAQALQNEGDYDEAIQLLESFILKNNGIKLSLVNYKLAELCEEKYPEKAESLYKQLLIETNESVATLNNIAWFYYTQQRSIEGKAYANLAVKKAPELAAVHNTLGVILLELGDLSKASQHLQTAVNIEPQNDKYKIWLAKSFIENGDHALASKIRSSINFEVLKEEVKKLFNDVYQKS
jgi:putative PEP-CTERM system TPR-repeat lipoprotein